jgi:FMN reductase
MRAVVTLSGSPSARSRSAFLLDLVEDSLRARGVAVRRIAIRELPPAALLHADWGDPVLREALQAVAQARAVVVATPLYKAAYAGLLKSFLDLLPQTALEHKPVLPLASGGSLAHLLALDYALKPVLAALGARHVLGNVFATEQDLPEAGAGYRLGEEVAARLGAGVESLVQALDDAAALRRWREGVDMGASPLLATATPQPASARRRPRVALERVAD